MNKSETNLGICMIFAHVIYYFKITLLLKMWVLGYRTSLTIVIKRGIDDTAYNIR